MNARRRIGRLVATGLAGLAAGGCATTYDPTEVRSTDPAVTTTTTLPTGTPAELLPALAAETQALEQVIFDHGDITAAGQRITNLWNAVRAQVGSVEPAMLAGFEAAVRLAQRAVASKQLAYATKAGKAMRAMADAYLAAHPA